MVLPRQLVPEEDNACFAFADLEAFDAQVLCSIQDIHRFHHSVTRGDASERREPMDIPAARQDS